MVPFVTSSWYLFTKIRYKMDNLKERIKRVFIPGEEWLYIKIYCGIKISDDILIATIKPLSSEFLKEGLIDKWFFIRYADPDEHLRIRFHLTSIRELNKIIQKLKNELLIYFENYQVWNMEFSTYKRELERYGNNNIENSESYFFFNSEFIINNLIKFEDDIERFLNVLKYIEEQIDFFELKDENKLDFLNKMQLNFKKEFKSNNDTIKELNKKYKEFPQKFNKLNTKSLSINQINLKKLVGKILTLNNNGRLNIPLENLIASYIHMTINRCFRSNQRLYELIMYDFLYKINRSKFARYGKL